MHDALHACLSRVERADAKGDDEARESESDAACAIVAEAPRRVPAENKVWPDVKAYEILAQVVVLGRGSDAALRLLDDMRTFRVQPSNKLAQYLLSSLAHDASQLRTATMVDPSVDLKRRRSVVGVTAAGELQRRWVLRRVFDIVDADGSGTLEKNEMLVALRDNNVVASLIRSSPALAWLCSAPRVIFNQIWGSIDVDGSGSCDFDEFEMFSKSSPAYVKRVLGMGGVVAHQVMRI